MASVGWLGSVVVFLMLAVVGLASDDPATVLEKSIYIGLSGLSGAMMWELSGDDAEGTLTKTIHARLRAGR